MVPNILLWRINLFFITEIALLSFPSRNLYEDVPMWSIETQKFDIKVFLLYTIYTHAPLYQTNYHLNFHASCGQSDRGSVDSNITQLSWARVTMNLQDS